MPQVTDGRSPFYKSRAAWRQQLRDLSYPTPFRITDLEQVQNNLLTLKQLLPQAAIFCAASNKTDRPLLRTLAPKVDGLEISLVKESAPLPTFGAAAHHLLYRSRDIPIRYDAIPRRNGREAFICDSLPAVERLAKYAPGARVYAEVSANSRSIDVRDLGDSSTHALVLMRKAVFSGLVPAGLTVTLDTTADRQAIWSAAVKTCSALITQLADDGIGVESLHICGLSLSGSSKTSTISMAAAMVADVARWLPSYIQLSVEPTEDIMTSSDAIVATVLGRKNRRDREEQLILDLDLEAAARVFKPATIVFAERQYNGQPVKRFALAVRTHTANDIGFGVCTLPATVNLGDRLYIINSAGWVGAVSQLSRALKIYYL